MEQGDLMAWTVGWFPVARWHSSTTRQTIFSIGQTPFARSLFRVAGVQ